jgi:hypothetical protein
VKKTDFAVRKTDFSVNLPGEYVKRTDFRCLHVTPGDRKIAL